MKQFIIKLCVFQYVLGHNSLRHNNPYLPIMNKFGFQRRKQIRHCYTQEVQENDRAEGAGGN